MRPVRTRLVVASSIGATATLIAQLSWSPAARAAHIVWILSAGIGAAHFVIAFAMAPKLVGQPSRSAAARTGAFISALAFLVFTPFFAAWTLRGSHTTEGPGGVALFTVLVGVFTLFAGGWALIVASAVIGALLNRFGSSG
jgi:hypothetical protein